MPTWLTNRLCRPIWQLWPICTRLSILVPAPMRVGWNVPRSMVVPAPISTSSPISTQPNCGTLTCRPSCKR